MKELGQQRTKQALRTLITRRRAIRWMALATMGLVVADALWWEPRVRIRIRRYRLGPNPEVRLVHFSDLHHRGNTRRLTRLSAKMMRYSPDFICFTGDIAEDVPCAREALRWLAKLPVPVYGVPGNHDAWLGIDPAEFKAAFRATGGDWLDNARASIPSKRVNLVGDSHGGLLNATPVPGWKTVLLLHIPDTVERIQNSVFDLILAGHSHGGQVSFPLVGPVFRTPGAEKYVHGLYQTPAGPLHVTAGVGWFLLPIRFNCPPEIAVIEL